MDLLIGLPPWEDNSYYKTVNGYHNEALQKFRHMTREELETSARTKIENLDVGDKIPLDEELDKVLCTKELLSSSKILFSALTQKVNLWNFSLAKKPTNQQSFSKCQCRKKLMPLFKNSTKDLFNRSHNPSHIRHCIQMF